MVYGGMEKPKDYYQLLGVPRDASLSAIRRAFQRLARRYEPERATPASRSCRPRTTR